jgi:hypothetical protein
MNRNCPDSRCSILPPLLSAGGGYLLGITSVTGVFARIGVGSVGGDGGDGKEDCGSMQKGGERRRRVVFLSLSLNSSASQSLFRALCVRFAGGESGGDGDSGSCNGCGGLGSKGVLRQCCVIVGKFSAAWSRRR